MNKNLYDFLIEENAMLLKEFYITKVVEVKKELLMKIKDNLEYIKLLEIKIQNESGVRYGK